MRRGEQPQICRREFRANEISGQRLDSYIARSKSSRRGSICSLANFRVTVRFVWPAISRPTNGASTSRPNRNGEAILRPPPSPVRDASAIDCALAKATRIAAAGPERSSPRGVGRRHRAVRSNSGAPAAFSNRCRRLLIVALGSRSLQSLLGPVVCRRHLWRTNAKLASWAKSLDSEPTAVGKGTFSHFVVPLGDRGLV